MASIRSRIKIENPSREELRHTGRFYLFFIVFVTIVIFSVAIAVASGMGLGWPSSLATLVLPAIYAVIIFTVRSRRPLNENKGTEEKASLKNIELNAPNKEERRQIFVIFLFLIGFCASAILGATFVSISGMRHGWPSALATLVLPAIYTAIVFAVRSRRTRRRNGATAG